MKKLLLFVFLLTSFSLCADETLKSRLQGAKPGDFMVTSQGPNYSVLLVRSKGDRRVILEEITVDQKKIDSKKIDWKEWIAAKAPNALSWTALVIDFDKENLSQCYSYTDRQWFFIDDSDYFVKQMLNLPFRPTRDNERKRVGPAPSAGEIDRRKIWKPQLCIEGKKQKKSQYQVVRSKWPADKTRLAGCIIELYLDAARPAFPFPYWMEVQHPHFTFKVRTVDSGSGITSPMPQLLTGAEKG